MIIGRIGLTLIYRQLLNGIYAANGLNGHRQHAAYLAALRPTASQLWQAYQTQQQVHANYADRRIQEAYLLRYFPSYIQPVMQELKRLRAAGHALPNVRHFKAAFFGSGPGPEMIGLILRLQQMNAGTASLTARLIDRAADDWAYAHNIVCHNVAASLWRRSTPRYCSHTADLADAKAMRAIDMDGTHFAMVQNCLNEVPVHLHDAVANNIVHSFSQLTPGAIALVIDRSNYQSTNALRNRILQRAAATPNVVALSHCHRENTSTNCNKLRCQVPDIVVRNLYHNGFGNPPNWPEKGLNLAAAVHYSVLAFRIAAHRSPVQRFDFMSFAQEAFHGSF